MPETRKAKDRPATADAARRNIEILDCTLRDGGYAVDFQFTAEDTALICMGLERAGVGMIEVGHGLGLGASAAGAGKAAATDIEYIEAAAGALKKSRFGVFFIPGIGKQRHIKDAASAGIGFIRIGVNVTEADSAAPFIRYAKRAGLAVHANLMKSYALPVAEFVRQAMKTVRSGADAVCVMDSAGGMLPGEAAEYVGALAAETGAAVAFHGHNNLSLALANSLEAARAGASIIDSSLLGLGRSAGNAQTEILAFLLQKAGFATGADLFRLLDAGERLLKPILAHGVGIDAISAVSGAARFHSGFMDIVLSASKKHAVDPRALIFAVGEIGQVEVTRENVEEIAARIAKKKHAGASIGASELPRLARASNVIPRRTKMKFADMAAAAASEALSTARKKGKTPVFTIAFSRDPKRKTVGFPHVRETASFVAANAEVTTAREIAPIVARAGGLVEYILIDPVSYREKNDAAKIMEAAARAARGATVLPYRDSDCLVAALETVIIQLFAEGAGKTVCVAGAGEMARALCGKLPRWGADLRLWRGGSAEAGETAESFCAAGNPDEKIKVFASLDAAAAGASILAGLLPRPAAITEGVLKKMKKGAVVIDAGVGMLAPGAARAGNRLGVRIMRIDPRAGFAAEIGEAIETHILLQRVSGCAALGGVRIVAGGCVGDEGAVVVDTISSPSRVIGIADGAGGLLDETRAMKFRKSADKVRTEILKNKLS